MNLSILTPERKIFEGDVYGILLPGVNGYFELLDNHAAIVSALSEGNLKIIKDKEGKDTESMKISGGFVEMSRNKAMVLIENAENIS
jgi:F-type H+-transporting ATPase subunit epsilon